MLTGPEWGSTNMHCGLAIHRGTPQNRTPHAVYVTPQELSGHSACSTSMFGYPIGAHDDLPSVVGISGPMGARMLGAGVVSPP
jgi:hypothetical protein